jgi:Tol biopolymer transport system component/DNA-binding winged helix-turn-helix (wHTH) protein
MAEAAAPSIYEFAGFRLDPRRRIFSGVDSRPIALKPKVFDTLLCLVDHAGDLLDKDSLMQQVWGDVVVEENSLNQHISTLRRALGESPGENRFIVTVPGRGYRFVALVSTRPGGSDSALPVSTQYPSRRARLGVTATLVLAIAASGYFAARRPSPDVPESAAPTATLGTVARVSFVTTWPGDEDSPSLSPDGRQVVFSASGTDGNRDLYLAQIGEQGQVQLTKNPLPDRDPAWSPDGNRIAFVREHPQHVDIVLIPALGGPERSVYRVPVNATASLRGRDAAPKLAWTPDSRRLVFTMPTSSQPEAAESANLHVLALDTGDVRPLLSSSSNVYDASPAISPDGAWLAFARFKPGVRHGALMVQQLDGELAPRGEPVGVPGLESGIYLSPTWFPDSKRLLFTDTRQIFEWPIGGEVRPIHSAGTAQFVALSSVWRDGRPRIVAANRTVYDDVWALPVDPTSRAAAGPSQPRLVSAASEHFPSFSPDGRWLAFVSSRAGSEALWLADADGANVRQLTHFDSRVVGYPSWSPDGRKIAFHAVVKGERHVYVTDLSGTPPQRLLVACCPSWSADGTRLYVVDPAAGAVIMRVSVANGAHERLFRGAGPVETADGAALLYWKNLPEGGIFMRALSGDPASNPERRIADDFPGSSGVVPVMDGFYYVHFEATVPRAVRFFDYAESAARDIAPAPPGLGLGLTLSPDGRELLYAADGGQTGVDLVLLEFSGPSGTDLER